MCNALFDIQAEIDDKTLDTLGFAKGGMFLIDEAQQRALVAGVYTHIVNTAPGGSGANTMIGLSQLGGRACYTSRVGKDEHGVLYAQGLTDKRVQACTATGDGITGICVVLVTPDAERTLCTHLGICRELEPADVALDALRASKYLYVTGYLWDTDSQKAAVLHAMRAAREAGVPVALSLSDPFCVNRHRDDFLAILGEYVDLVIGNEEEAQALTKTTNAHDAIRATAPLCRLASVTRGAQGALLRDGQTLLDIPGVPVHAVDTTGAGDLYAAGLLYGLTHDLPLETTGRLAVYLGAQVVAHLGPRLDALDAEAIARLCSQQ